MKDKIKYVAENILNLPKVTITLSGKGSQEVYSHFSKKHPRLFFIKNKEWGVGLMKLPDSKELYLAGKEKQALRTNRSRCIKQGFTFSYMSPLKYIDEILEVNKSADQRQGQELSKEYLDKTLLVNYFKDKNNVAGVFNKEGKLKAYAHILSLGEVSIFSRLMGHEEELKNGIMYFLISEAVDSLIDEKNKSGFPLWAMYDTFFGASGGLRYFKERLGFSPHKVSWKWQQ